MELDELKQQWHALNRKLDRNLALNLRLLTETRTRRMKLRLLPLLLFAPLQIVIGLAVAILSGGFWTGHLDNPPQVISGLALHAFGIALVVDAIMRILLITRINLAAPVVTIQRYLAYLRRWEIRSFKRVWMIVWALPPALLIVGAEVFARVDLWSRWRAGIAWVAIGSAAGMLVSYLIDRLARGRMDGLFAGHSVSAAQAVLDEIDEFARE